MSDSNTLEKIGALSAKVSAAHTRLDKLEIGIREDLKDLKNDLKELNAHMNRGKGWGAAFMVLAGTLGAGIVKILALIK